MKSLNENQILYHRGYIYNLQLANVKYVLKSLDHQTSVYKMFKFTAIKEALNISSGNR